MTILAASKSAAEMVGTTVEELVGENFEELTADDPTGVVDLLCKGQIRGYETERIFNNRGSTAGQPVHVWVRALDQPSPVEFAVGVLWPAGTRAKTHLPPPGPDEPHAVFGTISPQLLIERISEDVIIFGLDATDLIGAPILRLVTRASAADALVALAEAAQRATGVCLLVLVDGANGEVPAELLVRRLVPSLSFAFSLVIPSEDGGPEQWDAEEVLRMLGRGLHALDTGDVADAVDRAQPVGAEKLSAREVEIVARLVSGDRVPAIARSLFLSQGTIRNHLSNAFRKLGVTTQQELIDVFRGRSSP